LNCQYVRYFIIIKYWVKKLHANDKKDVKKVYNMLKYDFKSNPDKKKWCSLLYDLLCTLGVKMYGYFKILVIVYCFCHLLNSD